MALRVLIVDDDLEATHRLKRLLARAGYEVREENDSTHALTAAREFRPDVMILDFRMPTFHGGDVAWQIASDPTLHRTRMIMCTGCDMAEIATRLPPARIPILEKPLDAGALLQLIEECPAKT